MVVSSKGLNWVRVTKDNLCPVCGKPDWCLVSFDFTQRDCLAMELLPSPGGPFFVSPLPERRRETCLEAEGGITLSLTVKGQPLPLALSPRPVWDTLQSGSRRSGHPTCYALHKLCSEFQGVLAGKVIVGYLLPWLSPGGVRVSFYN